MSVTYQDRTFSEILVEEGLVSSTEIARILGQRESATEPLGDLLVRLDILTDKDKARCLGKQNGIPFVDLTRREMLPE
nr:hypothetical protein [Armatimonadota bacterium]